jgi:hypothetical protein
MALTDLTIAAMNKRIGELFLMVQDINKELDEISQVQLVELRRDKEEENRKRRQERASRELNSPFMLVKSNNTHRRLMKILKVIIISQGI